jgi:hypothetical protein
VITSTENFTPALLVVFIAPRLLFGLTRAAPIVSLAAGRSWK